MQFMQILLSWTNFGVAGTTAQLISLALLNKFYLIGLYLASLPTTDKIGEAAREAAKGAIQAFNPPWQELLAGHSSVYLATVKVSLTLATIFVAFWAVPFFNALVNEADLPKTLKNLTSALVISLMLAINNGSLITGISLVFRNTSNFTVERIQTATINGNNINLATRQYHLDQANAQALQVKAQECLLLPATKNPDGTDPQSTCINAAIEEVKKITQDSQNKNPLAGLQLNLDFDIGKIFTQAVNSQIQQELNLIFTLFEEAFIFLIEIASLLNTYIAPIFFALSLLPGQDTLIHVWLSGWLGLALVKVSYTLIVGIATTTIATSGDTNLLLMPLILGVLSPILALAIASGGGMALFNGLSSATAGGLRLLLRSGIQTGARGAGSANPFKPKAQPSPRSGR
jgi:hypothetical protein